MLAKRIDGEIVSIEPEFKIEAGKWYVCIREFENDGTHFEKGKMYYSPEDMVLSNTLYSADQKYENYPIVMEHLYDEYFRPATEEEIPQDSQRMVSAKAKECMYSKDNYTDEDRKVLCEDCEEDCKFRLEESHNKSESSELTEFNSKLCELFQRFRFFKDDVPANGDVLDYVEKHAKELLFVARKQFVAELPHWEQVPLSDVASYGTSIRVVDGQNYLEVDGIMISIRELLSKLP